MAGAVNFVWNYLNETQLSSIKRGVPAKNWLSAYELQKLTAGASAELGISAATIQLLCAEYVRKRILFKKSKLSWRSRRKSLGWIPFREDSVQIKEAASQVTYCGVTFNYFNSRPIEGRVKTGSICCDTRGRWYINLTCEIEAFCGPTLPGEVGIDLGLKNVVVTSTGLKVAAPKYYRQYENRLAKAQRSGSNRQVRTLHAKVKNTRKDFNHKLSTSLTREFSSIVVGDVSSSKLAKTTMAKSVYDVSWYQLKTFLKYKALARGSSYREVSEAYSTQMCAECGCIPKSSPRGKKDLNVREWVCSECGSVNDRDVNAAKNILRFGHESPQIQALIGLRSREVLCSKQGKMSK